MRLAGAFRYRRASRREAAVPGGADLSPTVALPVTTAALFGQPAWGQNDSDNRMEEC